MKERVSPAPRGRDLQLPIGYLTRSWSVLSQNLPRDDWRAFHTTRSQWMRTFNLLLTRARC